jgi:microcystin-dependent protein
MVGWGGTSSAMLKNSVGAFGGEELHTMTEAELAPHTHTYTASTSNPKSGTGDPAFCGAATENSGSTGSATPFNVVQPSLVLRPFIRY